MPWQGQLRVFPYLHGVAVIKCIVRVKTGKKEEEGVPTSQEVIPGQCPKGATVEFC